MKPVINALTDVPESFRPEYVERDGKFVLKLDGDVPGLVKAEDLAEANARLTEFRDNNRGLHSQLEQFKSRFNGFDPDEHKRIKDKLAEIEKHGVKGGADVRTAIAEALAPVQAQLAEITEREKNAQAKLARKELETVLTQAGLSAGVAEKAMADYLRRGLDVWKFEEGKPVARDGETPLYSKRKPAEPLSVEEWAAMLAGDAPHLFKPSNGGGARAGGNGTGERMTYDPNDPEDFLKNVDKIAKGQMIPIGGA